MNRHYLKIVGAALAMAGTAGFAQTTNSSTPQPTGNKGMQPPGQMASDNAAMTAKPGAQTGPAPHGGMAPGKMDSGMSSSMSAQPSTGMQNSQGMRDSGGMQPGSTGNKAARPPGQMASDNAAMTAKPGAQTGPAPMGGPSASMPR